jgi:hypothetical protein
LPDCPVSRLAFNEKNMIDYNKISTITKELKIQIKNLKKILSSNSNQQMIITHIKNFVSKRDEWENTVDDIFIDKTKEQKEKRRNLLRNFIIFCDKNNIPQKEQLKMRFNGENQKLHEYKNFINKTMDEIYDLYRKEKKQDNIKNTVILKTIEQKEKEKFEKYLMLNYGLTLEKYNQILESQSYKCKICGDWKKKLVVDHNHENGEVRAFICGKCNLIVGLIEKQPEVVHKCFEYIKNYSNIEYEI